MLLMWSYEFKKNPPGTREETECQQATENIGIIIH